MYESMGYEAVSMLEVTYEVITVYACLGTWRCGGGSILFCG